LEKILERCRKTKHKIPLYDQKYQGLYQKHSFQREKMNDKIMKTRSFIKGPIVAYYDNIEYVFEIEISIRFAVNGKT
jgi:hypothetical protein